jgi:hypothetical protein
MAQAYIHIVRPQSILHPFIKAVKQTGKTSVKQVLQKLTVERGQIEKLMGKESTVS